MKLASGRKSWEGIKSLLIQSLWVVGGKPAGGEGSDLTIKMRIPGVYKKSRANALAGGIKLEVGAHCNGPLLLVLCRLPMHWP